MNEYIIKDGTITELEKLDVTIADKEVYKLISEEPLSRKISNLEYDIQILTDEISAKQALKIELEVKLKKVLAEIEKQKPVEVEPIEFGGVK